jgi:hypothetical protein
MSVVLLRLAVDVYWGASRRAEATGGLHRARRVRKEQSVRRMQYFFVVVLCWKRACLVFAQWSTSLMLKAALIETLPDGRSDIGEQLSTCGGADTISLPATTGRISLSNVTDMWIFPRWLPLQHVFFRPAPESPI